MKRRTFVADLIEDGKTIATVTKYSWNAAIRGSHEALREIALARGVVYVGSDAVIYGPTAGPASTYTRTWSAPGQPLVTVRMTEVHS